MGRHTLTLDEDVESLLLLYAGIREYPHPRRRGSKSG